VSLKPCLKPTVPPSGDDEVDPSEHVSGKQHTDDSLEQEGDFLEGSSVSVGEDGGDGRSAGSGFLGGLGNFGPLVQVGIVLTAFSRGEPVSNDTGLQLCLWLVSTLDLAPIETALDADGECIRDRLGDPNGLVLADIPKDDICHIRRESEKPLSDGGDTRVLVIKSSHKSGRLTAEV